MTSFKVENTSLVTNEVEIPLPLYVEKEESILELRKNSFIEIRVVQNPADPTQERADKMVILYYRKMSIDNAIHKQIDFVKFLDRQEELKNKFNSLVASLTLKIEKDDADEAEAIASAPENGS